MVSANAPGRGCHTIEATRIGHTETTSISSGSLADPSTHMRGPPEHQHPCARLLVEGNGPQSPSRPGGGAREGRGDQSHLARAMRSSSPVTSYRPDAPPDLAAVLAHCFEKQRDGCRASLPSRLRSCRMDRPPHAAIYAECVAAVLGEQARTSALPPGGVHGVAQPTSAAVDATANALARSATATASSARTWTFVAIALTVGVIAVGGFWTARGRTTLAASVSAAAPATAPAGNAPEPQAASDAEPRSAQRPGSAPPVPQEVPRAPAAPSSSSSGAVEAAQAVPPSVSPAFSATVAPVVAQPAPKAPPERPTAPNAGAPPPPASPTPDFYGRGTQR
jgi:hypothetical protein